MSELNEILADVAVPTPEQPAQAPVVESAADTAANTDAPGADSAAAASAPVSEEAIEMGVDALIGFFDFSQNKISSIAVRMKKRNRMQNKYGDDWKDRLDELIAQVEGKTKTKDNLTPEELQMLKLEKNVQEILDDLPLTDADIKALKGPLMQIARAKGGTIPPEYILTLTVISIIGARVADISML